MQQNLGEEHLHGMLHLLFIRFILVYLIILLDIEFEDMSTGIRKLTFSPACIGATAFSHMGREQGYFPTRGRSLCYLIIAL
jgi:hypothetical protein